MQTPKARTKSIGVSRRNSPRSNSLEVSQKDFPKATSSQVSKENSPRDVRLLKTSPRYSEPTASSSKLATKAPKERSPKVLSDCRPPRSPVSEEKRPSRVAELESQISQLENDLKNVRDQLCSSETAKKQAQKDADESNQKLLDLSTKLEEPWESSEERGFTLQSKLEAIEKQHSHDSAALASALDEIKQLKVQLQMVAESEAAQIKHSESSRTELNNLEENLIETLSLVAEMKNQVRDCKTSEAQAEEIIGETLMQLEAAKKMVETLRSDGWKATEAYDAIAFELHQSRARVNFLEELVSKLKADITNAGCKYLEVEQLKSALEVAEIRHKEEQARSSEQTREAFETVEQIKSAAGQREAELEAELRKSKYEIEELKANMMDKETELQGICDENDSLIMQLENTLSGQREYETLKLEMKQISKDKISDMMSDLEEARAGEREAVMKVGYMTEEIDKSNRKAVRVTEQLEAAQAANTEMETELRKLKVQSDQWRKAAEVAASMLSAGKNGQLVERTGSMDSNYSPWTRRIASPYTDDLDEDLLKKKNANMLTRFGVLWKKPHK